MTTSNPITGTNIHCTDCDRRKKVAEIHIEGTCIELVSRHHGRNHTARIPILAVLESLAGTTGPSGVSNWIAGVYLESSLVG